MSIRSTNVFVPRLTSESLTSDTVLRHRYEEKSLGVFEVDPEDEDEEPAIKEEGSRSERVGRYFHWHLRRQVAFDIWWLVSNLTFSPAFLLSPLPSGLGNFLCLHHRTGKDHG
jgi:hypothetical protein